MPDTLVATGEEKQTSTQPVRGTLRVEVGTSSPILEAGRPFSVLVSIQNPFDVPVELTAVTAVAPVEFIDLGQQAIDRERDRELRALQKTLTDTTSTNQWLTIIKEILDLLKTIIMMFIHITGALLGVRGAFRDVYDGVSRVLIASSAAAPDSSDKADDIQMDRIKEEVKHAAENSDNTNKIYDLMQQLLLERARRPSSTTLLNAGNSTVQIFTMKTKRSLFFPPSTYEIPIQITYRISDTVNQDSMKYRLSIRSPLSAAITGSIFGSIAGYLVKDVFEERAIVGIMNGSGGSLLVWLVALLGNIVLSVVVVVAFARKRDTQPFISVEDFWGGLFVGAVTGYTGKSMIHEVIGSKASGH